MMESPENESLPLSGPEPGAAQPTEPDSPRTAEANAAPGRARRWTAVLLSLAAPGLGHLAIGYPQRMVAWYASLVATLILVIVGGLRGTLIPVEVAFLAGALLRLGAAADTLRLNRPDPLPRPRNVLIMVVGFFAFWEILAMNLRAHVVEAFQIPSGGNYPTLLVGDHIFATKLDRNYQRGEVVVFRLPVDPSTMYVKRIIGVGGDEVETRDGALIVNGTPVPRTRTSQLCADGDGPFETTCEIWQEELGDHRYGVARELSRTGADFGPVTIEPGYVFVMGDNRDNSSDSRVWGGVKLELIVGKVTQVWWSKDPRGGIRWERMNLRVE
jgi:signal peptidase I